MGIILSYEGELYRQPEESYNDEIKMIKVISKYEKPNYSSMIVYKDGDFKDLKVGDIVQIKGTNEELIFVCKTKKFVYLCPLCSDVDFREVRRLPKSKLFKKIGELDALRKLNLINNIKWALENNKFIPKEVKETVQSMVKKY